MNRMKISAVLALILVLSLLCAACGKTAPETQAPETAPVPEVSSDASTDGTLGLTDWTLTSSTWSSPNGATVSITATPVSYMKGQSAAFVVRTEEGEVANIPCEWDGTAYTASADLNAADGYGYYILMTAASGNTAEVPVNTPDMPSDETLINLASSLESKCSLIVDSSDFDGKWLSITGGTVVVETPKLKNQGASITCSEAVLVLRQEGDEVGRVSLELPAPTPDGVYVLALTGTPFQLGELEDDQQLTIELEVTLSNGQELSCAGGTWFYNAGSLMMSVG